MGKPQHFLVTSQGVRWWAWGGERSVYSSPITTPSHPPATEGHAPLYMPSSHVHHLYSHFHTSDRQINQVKTNSLVDSPVVVAGWYDLSGTAGHCLMDEGS